MRTHPFHPSVPDSVAAEVTRLKSSNKQRLLPSSATKLPLAPHSPRPSPNCGFTRTDLGVVLAVVGLLAVLATSVLGKISPAAHRAVCANNLRQMGVGVLKFASEHRNLPPWYVLQAEGGSGGRQLVYQHLLVFSNYVESPRIFVCPDDKEKQPAVDFSSTNTGVIGMGGRAAGYTIMTELTMDSPKSLLMGDRLATANHYTILTCSAPGQLFPAVPTRRFYSFSTGDPNAIRNPYWQKESHDGGIGNLLFADGSVQTTDSAGLVKAYLDNPVDGNKSGCTMIP